MDDKSWPAELNPPSDGNQRRTYKRKNTFKPGNQAAKGRKRAQKQYNTKRSRLLIDYEYVWTHQEGPFRTGGQEELKKFLDEDRRGFLQQYAQLEKAWLAKTEKAVDPLSAGGKDAPSNDEGEERAIELAERWLRDRASEREAKNT